MHNVRYAVGTTSAVWHHERNKPVRKNHVEDEDGQMM